MVSITIARESLSEKRISRHRHAQNEPDSLSERHRHPSEAVGSLDRTRRHSPRHGGRRSLSRLSLRRNAQRSRPCGGATCLESRSTDDIGTSSLRLEHRPRAKRRRHLALLCPALVDRMLFRQAKDQLKLDGYRVRHHRAVKRYWILVQLAYVYSLFESNSDFSDGLDLLRKRKGHSLVEFIYSAAKQNIPIDTIKNSSMWHKGYPVCLFLHGNYCYKNYSTTDLYKSSVSELDVTSN